jgi:TolB protein
MHATTAHRLRFKGVGALVVLFAVGSTVLAPPAGAAVSQPTGKIAFVWANFAFNTEEIATMQGDGTNQKKLTNEEGIDVSPAWSPDGRRIAFTSSRSMPPGYQGEFRFYSELYVMDADGSNVQRITFSVGMVDFQPAWSPDGRRIVVARGPGTSPPPDHLTAPTDLWIIDLDTGREQQLTNSPETWEGFADWSPDGRRIAFEGDLAEPGNDDVYTIGVDGRDVRRLTSRPGFDGDVRYSPDGASLAFDSDRTGNFDVFVMRTNGTNVRQLTNHPAFDVQPSYSPDGQFIAFASDRDGTQPLPPTDIFRMRADGTQQTNLTKSPGVIEFDPHWQPA